ncbi:MAG: rhodanese-like domain-containing protein [Bacteroidota bacterium]|nr:rhodanese-like domain-containing protein [Bacteroidota bacterium]
MNLKLIAIIAFSSFSLSACSQKPSGTATHQSTQNKYELLSPADFNKRLQAEPGVLIDVRTPNEQKKGMIKNAVSLDIFRDDFEAEIDKLDKSKTYYVYCAAGGRSAEASELMQKKGFARVIDLEGGFTKWKNEGLPVELK